MEVDLSCNRCVLSFNEIEDGFVFVRKNEERSVYLISMVKFFARKYTGLVEYGYVARMKFLATSPFVRQVSGKKKLTFITVDDFHKDKYLYSECEYGCSLWDRLPMEIQDKILWYCGMDMVWETRHDMFDLYKHDAMCRFLSIQEANIIRNLSLLSDEIADYIHLIQCKKYCEWYDYVDSFHCNGYGFKEDDENGYYHFFCACGRRLVVSTFIHSNGRNGLPSHDLSKQRS